MRRIALGMLFAALAGCGTFGTEPGEAPAVVRDESQSGADVELLLAGFARARRLPAGELAREHESARLAFAKRRTDYNRVRYAMLLALPAGARNDHARALDLLDPVVRNGSSPLQGLAVLLTTFLQEQRRLESGAQALQQKLDALRSLERNLSEREQGGGGRRQ